MKTPLLLLLTACGSVVSFPEGGSNEIPTPLDGGRTTPDTHDTTDPTEPADSTLPDDGDTDSAPIVDEGDSAADSAPPDPEDSGTLPADDTGPIGTGGGGGDDEPGEMALLPAYTGPWTAGGSFTSLGITGHPWHVTVADLDLDGLTDIIYSWNLALFGGDELHLAVVLQDGAGGLAVPVSVATGHNTAFAGSFRVADLDGDSAPDLIAGHDDGVTLFFNDGAGGFGAGVDLLGDDGTTVRIGDMDGDGDADIVARGGAGETTLWENDGVGGFSVAWTASDRAGTLGESAAIYDLDRDGDLDYVVADPQYFASASVVNFRGLLNDGTGLLDTVSVIPAPAEAPMVSALEPHDLDGDGYDELIATYGVMSTTGVDAYIGAWGWSGTDFGVATNLVSRGTFALGIGIGDLDGDGRADIVAVNELTKVASVMFDGGGGSWSSFDVNLGFWADSAIFPDVVAAGDVNGDGCGDLVFRTDTDIVVAWGSGC